MQANIEDFRLLRALNTTVFVKQYMENNKLK